VARGAPRGYEEHGGERLLLLRGAEAQCGPGVVDGHLTDGLHAMAGQDRDEPVTVEICPELAALGVADPRQAIRARRRHRLLCLAQVVLPDDEGDHRVGVCCASRCHHARQHQARRRIQDRHRLSRPELQLAADVHALSMPRACRRPQSPRATRHSALRVLSQPRLRRTSDQDRRGQDGKRSHADVSRSEPLGLIRSVVSGRHL